MFTANMAYYVTSIFAAIVTFFLPLASALGSTSYNGLAKTPQMGWGKVLRVQVL